ncbi:helix-turn-helix domain-containing protein [Chryseolinea sp. T2]|uniref:AraC family transcriptional regulator n=1 Tax=Chryseolinea sp. T2 TaxID=3129255 RepID=UPI00307736AA
MGTFIHQFFFLLCYGSIILSAFVVLLLNSRDVKKGRANVFLSILLGALAFSVAHILFAGAVVSHLSASVYSVGDPTFFLIAPLLWFYIRALCGEYITMSWSTLLHFVPFLLIIALSLSLRSIQSQEAIDVLNRIHGTVILAFWVLLIIQFTSYLTAARRKWQQFRLMIQQEVSNTEHVSIEWVQFYMIIFLTINAVLFISLIVALHLDDRSWLIRITAVLFSVSIFALGYKGILQREIFSQHTMPLTSEPKASMTVRTNNEDERVQQLKSFMEKSKPYLDAELTLTSLATQLNITRGQLSLLINEGTGSNFYDFVNRYRVDEVKRLMTDPSKSNFNMLGLALDAGFKSKSTFNLIFKRFTGLTPTEYRKNSSEQSSLESEQPPQE